MLTFDESAWPIVRYDGGGAFTVADAENLIAGFERALARGEPFALRSTSTDEPETAPQEGARPMLSLWVKANNDLLGRRCAGLAYITDEAGDPAAEKVRAGIETFYGFTIRMFPKSDGRGPAEADAWLADRLRAHRSAPPTAREETATAG